MAYRLVTVSTGNVGGGGTDVVVVVVAAIVVVVVAIVVLVVPIVVVVWLEPEVSVDVEEVMVVLPEFSPVVVALVVNRVRFPPIVDLLVTVNVPCRVEEWIPVSEVPAKRVGRKGERENTTNRAETATTLNAA